MKFKTVFLITAVVFALLSMSGAAMADDVLPIRDENDEYILIQSEEDFKKLVDPANENYPLNEKYRLMTDINLESADWFIPIGSAGTPFTGVFDGNNKTISNLELMDYKENVGLFGYTEGATVENLILKDFLVTGEKNVGSLIGNSDNTNIFDVHVYNANILTIGSNKNVNTGGLIGHFSGGEVSNCSAESVFVSSSGNNTGGLIGQFDTSGSVTNSFTTGTVDGFWSVGGFVGYMNGSATIADCHSKSDAAGTIAIGGFIGNLSNGFISNSCASGNVEVGTGAGGGFVGLLGGSASRCPVITSCSATGSVQILPGGTPSQSFGGFAGSANTAFISNCYSTGNVDGGAGLMAGGFIGSGVANLTISESYVSDASVNGSDGVGGFVGFITGSSGSTIKILDCYVTNGSVDGSKNVGGFAGIIDGYTNFANCSSQNTVVGNPTANCVGGFVGNMRALAAIPFSANISESCVLGGSVSGDKDVGGFVGNMDAFSISESYVTNVLITGNSSVGGFVGAMDKIAEIENVYVEFVSLPDFGTNIGGFIGSMASKSTIRNAYVLYETFAGAGADTTGIVDSFFSDAAFDGPIVPGGLNSVSLEDLKKIKTFQTEGGYVLTSWDIASSPDSSIWYVGENKNSPGFVWAYLIAPPEISESPELLEPPALLEPPTLPTPSELPELLDPPALLEPPTIPTPPEPLPEDIPDNSGFGSAAGVNLGDGPAQVIPSIEPEFPIESGVDPLPPVSEETQLPVRQSSGWLLAASFIISGCMFLVLLRKEKSEED